MEDKNNPGLSVGQHLHGFEIVKITELPRLHNIVYQLKHHATGAEMLHLSNEDDNNCFGVAFRTTPTDSTGVAHILEHTALCGSQKYPVRDPFFSMIKRSMNTFMNAFTASDWTMYPFATQSKADFFNLLNIYLDAAFFPALTELNFKQEGHRLDFEEEGNIDSSLVIKGVVYNEMKGAMSSPGRVLDQKMAEQLFPDVTYRFNSGGDPAAITQLTHQQLIEFHQKHYHPSNSLFYSYGTFPLAETLAVIEKMVLSSFDKIDIHTAVPCQKRFTTPKQKVDYYPLSDAENDGQSCQVALGWLTCDVTNPEEVLALQILNQILLGHSGAPLKKALLESNLGKSLTDASGLDDDYREAVFSVGLQGVKESDTDRVEQLIMETLNQIVKDGITPAQIESAIHQIELDTREISGGHYPYSLNLLFRFFTCWMHNGDPLQALDFDRIIAAVKNRSQHTGYFEGLIEQYLLKNNHRSRVTILPDATIAKKEAEQLQAELKELKAGLSKEELLHIQDDAQKLKSQQEEEEDLSCLPTLSVKDIPGKIRYLEPALENPTLQATYYDQPTNGISYFTWYFQIPELTDETRQWLPLLSYLFPNCGAGDMNYEEVAQKVSRYTGGFGAAIGLEPNFREEKDFHEYLTISSKALDGNIDPLFELATTILNQWTLSDMKRVRVLVNQRANQLAQSVVQSGHSYAVSLATRGLTPTLAKDEIYSGIHQVRFMKKVSQMPDAELLEKLQELKTWLKQIISAQACSSVIISDSQNFATIESKLKTFYETLPNTTISSPTKTAEEIAFEPSSRKEACLITTPVSYVVQSRKIATYGHPDSPLLLVLATLIKSCFLHGELREKGGAYGGLSSYDADNGVMSFLSYRDPHLCRTFEVYDQVLEWLKKGQVSEEDVEQSVLQTCSRLDTPLSPAGKAMSEYILARKGKNKELRQEFRNRILNCTRKELIDVGIKWLSQGDASLAAVTSQEMVERETAQLDKMGINCYELF